MSASILSTALLLIALIHRGDCHSSHSHVDCTLNFCELELSDELIQRYKITVPEGNTDEDCADCKITVQLELDGYSWLGMGVAGSSGMIGSHVVIGEPGLSEPKAYYLNGKDQSLITRSNIVLEDATIDFVNGNTVMEFTTTFESLGTQSPIEEEPVGISLSGTSSFIWAHGKDGQNELAYHGSNKAVYELNDMSSGTASEAAASKMTISSSISSYKSKWFAHGVLAFISWGICAPVAISSSILRNFNKHLTKWWFYIHLGCNSVNYFFTFVVFFLALSTIKKEGSSHWYHAHNKMGLAIFLLATFQVAGGLFRPKTKENESKSKLRQYWELGHSISGIMIFLFGVWQMYAGLVLYNSRYENSNFTAVLWFYIIWMGLWTGLIVGGTIYKWVNKKGEESTEKNVDNTNIAPQAEREAENEENKDELDESKEGTDDFTDNEPAAAADKTGKQADALYV